MPASLALVGPGSSGFPQWSKPHFILPHWGALSRPHRVKLRKTARQTFFRLLLPALRPRFLSFRNPSWHLNPTRHHLLIMPFALCNLSHRRPTGKPASPRHEVARRNALTGRRLDAGGRAGG